MCFLWFAQSRFAIAVKSYNSEGGFIGSQESAYLDNIGSSVQLRQLSPGWEEITQHSGGRRPAPFHRGSCCVLRVKSLHPGVSRPLEVSLTCDLKDVGSTCGLWPGRVIERGWIVLWGRDRSERNWQGKAAGKVPPTRALERGSPVHLHLLTGMMIGKVRVSQSREVCS